MNAAVANWRSPALPAACAGTTHAPWRVAFEPYGAVVSVEASRANRGNLISSHS